MIYVGRLFISVGTKQKSYSFW